MIDKRDLGAICANCKQTFGFHGAPEPHQCPGIEVAPGKWEARETTFLPAQNSNVEKP